MRECEVANAKARRCKGQTAKAKVRRRDGERAIYYYRSFAFASSHFHLHPFHCIQQVSVDLYMTFDAETVLAQGLSIYLRYYSYACVRPSCFLRMFINILLCNITYMYTSMFKTILIPLVTFGMCFYFVTNENYFQIICKILVSKS